jgi:putative chitinase
MIARLLARLFGSRPTPAPDLAAVDEALYGNPYKDALHANAHNTVREEKPVATPPAEQTLPSRKQATLDRTAFFAQARAALNVRFSQRQVECVEAIFDAMAGQPISWVAYALATAWHETGPASRMVPNVENLNYSVSGLLNTFGRHRISRADAEKLGRRPGEPALPIARQRAIANIIYGGAWGRDNLGNTEPDDGWQFRGRGLAHITGRTNYERAERKLGVPMLSQPDLALELGYAVRTLVDGMTEGWFTSHTFARHLPLKGAATAAQFGQARRIINGQDRSGDIAANALAWQGALRKGEWR